ncbi:Uma2 family endonuclease [bacterium]|nr:Uma2 family endonuclease [bacterium]
MPIPKPEERYTYRDYLTWPDEERWELIDGFAWGMAPSPSTEHQRIVFNLAGILYNALKKKQCIAGIAPVDVYLSEENIVQPDVFIVCDEAKITEKHIEGAPDIVFEVTSESTALKDRREKKQLYQHFGVKEYILIDPKGQYAEQYCLREKGTYGAGIVYGPRDELVLPRLESLILPLWDVFGVERNPNDKTV